MTTNTPINRVLVLISCALLLTGCQQLRPNSSAKTIPSMPDLTCIYAQADGRVEKLLVLPGQLVQAGEPLLQLAPVPSPAANNSPVVVSKDRDFTRPGPAIQNDTGFARQPDQISSAYLMALDVITYNLANANTTAFKQLQVHFQEMAQPEQELNNEQMANELLPAGVQTVPGLKLDSVTRNFSMGGLVQTHDRLDLAIQGDGFFEVKLPDGTRAYTRDGSFNSAPDGHVTTADGFPLNSGFQPIGPETTSISISRDGSMICLNAHGAKTSQLKVCRFADPTMLQALGGNLYRETAASGAAEYGSPGQKGFGELRQGYLELSNVNVAALFQELNRLHSAYAAYTAACELRQRLRMPLSQTNLATAGSGGLQ
jgi:flagellar basal-body rod protein FlgG